MNQERFKKFAYQLFSIDSPSGFTKHAIDFLEKEANDLGFKTSRNQKGNLHILVSGKDHDYKVGISAHTDTLGLMVRSINADGTLRFTNIGGPSLPTLDGEYCRIITRSGKTYTGTILSSTPAVHVFKEANTAPRNPDTMIVKIDEIVKNELDKARQNFTLSDTGQMIGTAESYYKQIFDSEKIMTDMRDDFSEHLSKSINSVVNDRLYDLQNSLGGEWGRKLLGKSKLASTITNAINKEVANVVNAVISDEVIAETSQDIIDLVTNIQSSAKEQIETQFGDEIEYAEKLQKSVEDKIELFEEQKKIYQEKLEAQVEKLQEAINEAIQQVEQIIINEISKVIKIDASSLNLGI